jgi:hypothetical protein
MRGYEAVIAAARFSETSNVELSDNGTLNFLE